jgi:hypothetical protein
VGYGWSMLVNKINIHPKSTSQFININHHSSTFINKIMMVDVDELVSKSIF